MLPKAYTIITFRNITVLCQKEQQAESCSNEHEQTAILMLPKASSVESAITCSETQTHTHTHTHCFSYQLLNPHRCLCITITLTFDPLYLLRPLFSNKLKKIIFLQYVRIMCTLHCLRSFCLNHLTDRNPVENLF